MKGLKRVILGLTMLIIVSAFILSGCAKLGGSGETTDTHESMQAPDISRIAASTEGYENNRTINTDKMSRDEILETTAGVYALNIFDHNVNLIEYFESATGPRTILCGKPECYHNSTDCNAYIDSEFLGMYNDRLYYTGNISGTKICSMALDGSDHRTEMLIPDELIKYGSGLSVQMDSGYLYCTDNSFEEDKASFFRIHIEDQSVEYAVSEEFSLSAYLDCYPYNDTLYIFTVGLVGDERVETEYAYSFTDKELVDLSEIAVGGPIGCTDTTLYTSTGPNVWKHDIQTGENTLLFEIDSTQMCSKTFDGTYFYIEEWSLTALEERYFFVYDLDGKLICKAPVDFENHHKVGTSLYTVTKDALIFSATTGEMIDSLLDFAVLKSDIEKGEIRFIDISDN